MPDRLVLSVVAATTNQSSAPFGIPLWAKGMLIYVFRISGDPGVAANVNIRLERQDAFTLWKEWARSANADFDTVLYTGFVVHPELPALEFATVTPAVDGGNNVKRVPLPGDAARITIGNVNAVSLDYDVYVVFLR